MSVSMLEVIESAGYNLSTPEDAEWLLSVAGEFEELVEQCEDLLDATELEEDD